MNKTRERQRNLYPFSVNTKGKNDALDCSCHGSIMLNLYKMNWAYLSWYIVQDSKVLTKICQPKIFLQVPPSRATPRDCSTIRRCCVCYDSPSSAMLYRKCCLFYLTDGWNYSIHGHGLRNCTFRSFFNGTKIPHGRGYTRLCCVKPYFHPSKQESLMAGHVGVCCVYRNITFSTEQSSIL